MGQDMETFGVGDTIVFHDPSGKQSDALVTCIHSREPMGCINLVTISKDESKTDQYGRQTERYTSVGHRNENWVHGMYWRFANEDPLPYKAPAAV